MLTSPNGGIKYGKCFIFMVRRCKLLWSRGGSFKHVPSQIHIICLPYVVRFIKVKINKLNRYIKILGFCVCHRCHGCILPNACIVLEKCVYLAFPLTVTHIKQSKRRNSVFGETAHIFDLS